VRACRPARERARLPEAVWNPAPERVRAPYGTAHLPRGHHLSRTGHVQPGLKLGSPLPKANYTQRPIAHSTVRER
jgi:hypothetical protein